MDDLEAAFEDRMANGLKFEPNDGPKIATDEEGFATWKPATPGRSRIPAAMFLGLIQAQRPTARARHVGDSRCQSSSPRSRRAPLGGACPSPTEYSARAHSSSCVAVLQYLKRQDGASRALRARHERSAGGGRRA